MNNIYFSLVFVVVTGCGVASEHLEIVRPYLNQIETLEAQKVALIGDRDLTDLSEEDQSIIDYLDSEIARVREQANDASRNYEINNRDNFETKNFYKGDNAFDVLIGR